MRLSLRHVLPVLMALLTIGAATAFLTSRSPPDGPKRGAEASSANVQDQQWPTRPGQLHRKADWSGGWPTLPGPGLANFVGSSDAIIVGRLVAAEVVETPVAVPVPAAYLRCEPGPEADAKGGCPTPPANLTIQLGNYVTRYTFSVTQSLKGDAAVGSNLSVRVPGGIAGADQIVYAPYDPFFYLAEDHLLFLWRDPEHAASFRLTGSGYGAYLVSNGLLQPNEVMTLGFELYQQQNGTPWTPDGKGIVGELYEVPVNVAVQRVSTLLSSAVP